LTGDVGTGKSTIVAHLLDTIDRRQIIVAQLATTNLDPADALRIIADRHGVSVPDRSKAAVLGAIEAFLAREQASGRRVLQIIDEAQNLPLETLEELRMLTNLRVDGRHPLQCFLVGQTQFRDTLASPQIEQLRQRVIASCHLEPLTPDETKHYVEHRLQTAGWQGRPSFAPDLLERVHATTSGIPRRINLLLGRLLLFGALEHLDHLDEGAIASVISDLESEVVGIKSRPLARPRGSAPLPQQDSTPEIARLRDRIDELETALAEVVELLGDILERRAPSQQMDHRHELSAE
jgi:type II secretory pathway predicted ATPase ExeA